MDENLRGGVFKHGGLAWPKHAYANHILQCVLFLWTTLGPAQRWKVTGSGWHHIQWGKCCGRRLTQVDLHKLDAKGWKKVAVHFVLVVQQTNCPNGLSRTVYPNPKFQNFLPMFGPVKKIHTCPFSSKYGGLKSNQRQLNSVNSWETFWNWPVRMVEPCRDMNEQTFENSTLWGIV